MERQQVKAIGNKYYKYSLWIIAGLSVLLFFLTCVCDWSMEMVNGIVVSVVFSLLSSIVYISVWKALAVSSTKNLTKFYLGEPIVRMLAAMLLIISYLLIAVKRFAIDGFSSSHLLYFIAPFTAYYFALLIFDSIFFVFIEKNKK